MTLHQAISRRLNGSWKGTFFLIWTGQVFSLLGSNLVQFALVWWLTKTTGSAAVLATANLVALLPNVVLGPFAGALVDRWNRRRVIIMADGAIALVTLWLVYLFWKGSIQTWHVYLALFIRALGSSFHWPAMQASTSLMVPKKHLARIAGLNESLHGLLNIASPPLGALLLELMPMFGVLSIDILTAILAILPLLIVAIPQPPKTAQASLITPRQLLRDVRDGFKYLTGWKGLFYLAIAAAVINFLMTPAFTLMPLLVTDYFKGGVWELGWLESIFGSGIVAGGLLLSAWGGFKKKIHTSLFGVIGMGIGILLFTMAPPHLFLFALVGMAITGLMNALANGPLHAIMQANVAPQVQGRVFTVLNSMTSGMSPLGMIAAAPIAELLGIRAWFLIGASGALLMGMAGLLTPAIINLEDEQKNPPV